MVDKMPIRQKDLGRNGVVLLYHSFIPLLQYSIIICSILPLLQYHTSVTVLYLGYSIIPLHWPLQWGPLRWLRPYV